MMTFPRINSDLFVMAYASYVAALADASIQDNQPDPALFAFLQKTLDLMNQGLDYEVLTNIFEIQILSRFGVSLNFHDCIFCHRTRSYLLIFPFNMAGCSAQSIITRMFIAVILIPIFLFAQSVSGGSV